MENRIYAAILPGEKLSLSGQVNQINQRFKCKVWRDRRRWVDKQNQLA